MAKQGRSELSDRTKKLLAGASIAIFIVLTLLIAWFVGRPMIQYIQEPEKFQAWVDSAGAMGRVYFLGIQILQVVIAIIPGEPVEMGAGYAFGAVEGTLLCMLGTIAGSMLVYFFVRRFGVKAVEIFSPLKNRKPALFEHGEEARRAYVPIDVHTRHSEGPAGLLRPAHGHGAVDLAFITAVARIPSVVTSTIGGGALGVKTTSSQ